MPWYPGKNAINCHFYIKHEPCFYEDRSLRLDRKKKFVEITREKFQLTNHSVHAPPRSESRTS
jgi:hypothetical protein